MVCDDHIAACLDDSPQQALATLIDAALDGGGKDNITISILENR